MKTIYCPLCGRKVMSVNEKLQNNLSCKCNNCKKKVTYYPAEDMTSVSDIGKRETSSGMRFL